MSGFSAIDPLIEETTGHRKTRATPIFVAYLKPFRPRRRSPGWRGASGCHESSRQKYRSECSKISRHHDSSFPQGLGPIFHGKHLGLLEAQKKGAFTGPLEGLNGWFQNSRGDSRLHGNNYPIRLTAQLNNERANNKYCHIRSQIFTK